MVTPEGAKGRGPNMCAHWWAYDVELCNGVDELKRCLQTINYHGLDVVSLTQNGEVYTVLFRRLG